MAARSKFGDVLKKTDTQNYFYVSLAISLVTVAIIFFSKNFLPPIIPLLYGKPAGEEQLVSYWFFFVAPIASIIISIVNFFVSLKISDAFLKRALVSTSILFSILVMITSIKIIFLVGFFK